MWYRLVLLIVILLVTEFYFIRKVRKSILEVFPAVNRRKLKLGTTLFLIIFNLYPVGALLYGIYILISGNVDAIPPLNVFIDYIFIYPFWTGVLLMVQTIIFFLIIDVLRVVLYPIYKNKFKDKIRVWQARVSLILVILFAVYIPIRIIYDFNSVNVQEFVYEKENLPSELEGFKIALGSDIQADRYTNAARLQNFVDKVNEANPDLILIAGDIITNTPNFINTGAEYVGKLKAEYGVYSCIGDHDNWAYRSDNARSLREIKEALAKKDVQMIDDQNRIIDVDSTEIGITFITHTYARRSKGEQIQPLSQNLNGADLKILLTHQPQKFLINLAKQNNYDLFFAGHTHGGQLTFIFPFVKITPTIIETPYVKGSFMFDDMMAVVTGGLGMSLVPMRYNSTPEISIIKLMPKNTKIDQSIAAE